jgi:ATP-dependent Clp protease ATP-binding subunit ClpA
MWQRFTENARQSVFFAQEHAQRLGQAFVSTEHLLLGLLDVEDCTAVKMLLALGIDPQAIRQMVEESAGDSAVEAEVRQEMTLTPRAKRVIDLAYDEAKALRHNYIGTEHLLLGLRREEAGFAARVLSQLGVPLDDLRSLLPTMLKEDAGSALDALVEETEDALDTNATELLLGLILADMPPGLGFVLADRGIQAWTIDALLETDIRFDTEITFAELLVHAQGIAADRKDAVLTGDHFVLAILHRGESLAAYVLESLGLTYSIIEAAMDA